MPYHCVIISLTNRISINIINLDTVSTYCLLVNFGNVYQNLKLQAHVWLVVFIYMYAFILETNVNRYTFRRDTLY